VSKLILSSTLNTNNLKFIFFGSFVSGKMSSLHDYTKKLCTLVTSLIILLRLCSFIDSTTAQDATPLESGKLLFYFLFIYSNFSSEDINTKGYFKKTYRMWVIL